MEVYVDFSCKENSKTGRTKITVSDFDSTSIRDVKYAIQEAIQAPVCDQQLFYQGQRLTDDTMPLSRLYFREGDCLKVQFLAAANIPAMNGSIRVLKNAAQKIVEKLQGTLPRKLSEGNNPVSLSQWFYDQLEAAVNELCYTFFLPWKGSRTIANRHYFVQEGGFDAFLEVLKFSRELNLIENGENYDLNDAVQVALVNINQLIIYGKCLTLLCNFGETLQDQKFILSKGVLPLIIDALLIDPHASEDITVPSIFDLALVFHNAILRINEAATGCCSGLAECDAVTQEQVSKMPQLIDQLLLIIDRWQTKSSGYSLSSSQAAANTLFHCTYNVKSAQHLVDCGALGKMLNITRELLTDEDSDTPLRYYCCLFLARMRSAPLVTLDRDTCVAIDQLIDVFLSNHEPNEISAWEEEMRAIWVKITPVVHLAFAAGQEHYSDMHSNLQITGQQCDGIPLLNKEACFVESKILKATTPEADEAESDDVEKLESTCISPFINSVRTEETPPESMEISSLTSENEEHVMTSLRSQSTWPGSMSTQKLGIFSLVPTLSIKENQQTALSENLLPYLVCLSWHLKCDEKEKLIPCLAKFNNVPIPSLKVAAKSVLAIKYGLDMVVNL